MKRLVAALLMALPLAAQPQGDKAEAVQTFQLQNGLRVLLLENHQHPLIRLQLRAIWAPLERKEARPNPEIKENVPKVAPQGPMPLESLALRVLSQCAVGNRSRKAFNRAVEERGLNLQLSGVPDGPVWNLSGGSPEAETAFALLADAAARPIPDGGDLDALRLRLIHDLHEQGIQETARIDFFRQGERPDVALEPITEKNLGQIYLEDLQRSIMMTLRPDRAVLAISGDLNLSQARQLVQLNFGTWNEWSGRPAPITPKPTTTALVSQRVIVAADRPETILALPLGPKDKGQRAARDLLSLWLPRLLGSHRCRIHPGAAGWRSLILTSEASEASLREELLAVKHSGVKARDLEQAKKLWISRYRALALHPQEHLSRTAEATLMGAEPTELEIQNVGLTGINETLRSWLDLDLARVLVLGSEPSRVQKPK